MAQEVILFISLCPLLESNDKKLTTESHRVRLKGLVSFELNEVVSVTRSAIIDRAGKSVEDVISVVDTFPSHG